MTETTHPPLPSPLPADRVPGGWSTPESTGETDYTYLNDDAKMFVSVYSDAGLGDRAWGVNLERMHDNPNHAHAGGDGEQQIAATTVRVDGYAGEGEPEASLHAVALGYMKLGVALDAGGL